ncbi:MAG: hypothetical protein AAB877_02725 [Patescibacteria group bacterium]
MLGEITINPFDEKLLKAASYTFSLGKGFRKLRSTDVIDTQEKHSDFEEFEMDPEGYLLKPGEFIICHTQEILRLPDTIGCFLTMRGYLAQIGIDALQCEIFCEPGSHGGWDGKLMLETSNRGSYPVRLVPGIKVVKAIFLRLQQ